MRFSFDKYWSITKNKSLEIQLDIGKAEWDLFRFVFECRRKGDHAGVNFSIELFERFYFGITFSDNRHWDYDNDCWVVYPE